MAMYDDKIEIRSHCLELLSTIYIDKVKYFSNVNSGSCNLYIDQSQNMIFNLQPRRLFQRDDYQDADSIVKSNSKRAGHVQIRNSVSKILSHLFNTEINNGA